MVRMMCRVLAVIGAAVLSLSSNVAAADKIRVNIEPESFGGDFDPHVWTEVSLWSKSVDVVVKALSEVRPDGKAGMIRHNVNAMVEALK